MLPYPIWYHIDKSVNQQGSVGTIHTHTHVKIRLVRGIREVRLEKVVLSYYRFEGTFHERGDGKVVGFHCKKEESFEQRLTAILRVFVL